MSSKTELEAEEHKREERRRRGAELSRRAEAMEMSPDEIRRLVNYLIGAAPEAVEGALDYVQSGRTAEPPTT